MGIAGVTTTLTDLAAVLEPGLGIGEAFESVERAKAIERGRYRSLKPMLEALHDPGGAIREPESEWEYLKARYGRRGAMPKRWGDIPEEFIATLDPAVRRQCCELVRLGMEVKAIRLAYCRKLGRVFECSNCGRPAKNIFSCKNAMCLACAKKNFDTLFRRYFEVDSLIPASVRSLPGWTWHVLDLSFRHDGDFPKQWELRAMVRIIRRTIERAVRKASPAKCQEWYRARQGCRLRLNEDGTPMISLNGWPIGGARDGEARELVGWQAVFFPEHDAPDNEARKWGERGKKKKVPACWKLRFGYELIRVREFGFDNTNAHFHCAYFGPPLDYWKNDDPKRLVCGGHLVEIFKEQTRRPVKKGGLGEESYTIFFEPARHGFGSVLAHALKYTKKNPVSAPEGLARLEHVIRGTRRVALLGAHYGVPLKPKPRDPRCPSCGAILRPLDGLGLVPLSEIADLPDVVQDAFTSFDDEFNSAEVRGP